MNRDNEFLDRAIALALQNVAEGGRPFGAVAVRDGQVIAEGVNEILATQDPTTHAEMQAVRHASRALGSPSLAGVAVYASGHPCPMCMAAMRLSGVQKVVYAYSNDDAEPFGLSTAAVAAELARPEAERSIDIRYRPHRPERLPNPYEVWQKGRHP